MHQPLGMAIPHAILGIGFVDLLQLHTSGFGPQEKNPIPRHAGRLTEVDRPRISRHVERSAASKMTRSSHGERPTN